MYPGRTTLPDEFVKLNDILSRLSDVTLNYDKKQIQVQGQHRSRFQGMAQAALRKPVNNSFDSLLNITI